MVLVDGYLGVKYSEYLSLVSLFEERKPESIIADFDSDGKKDVLQVKEATENTFLTIESNDKELFRTNYMITDGTFRTHLAVYTPRQRTHLLLYDRRKGPFKKVFEFDGNSMIPVPPTSDEKNILNALEASDDGGTRHLWFLYFLLRPVFFIGYLFALIWRLKRET